MPSKVVEDCARLLAAQELNIAFAESATVGRMAAEFGLTDAGVKEDLLKVDDKLVEEYTPESAEVTEAAAKGLRALMPAKIHVAITGLTCPGGSESPEKPVGTMFIHCIADDFAFSDRSTFTGGKEVIIMKCIENFADLLIQKISPAK
jgi:nicotinamide-nucleotide amidase